MGQGVGAMSATESEVSLAGHGKDRKWFFNLDMDLPTSPIFLGHFPALSGVKTVCRFELFVHPLSHTVLFNGGVRVS